MAATAITAPNAYGLSMSMCAQGTAQTIVMAR